MKQTFIFLTLSRVFNDCRDSVGRLSTLILLFVFLFGFTTNAWADYQSWYLTGNPLGSWDKDNRFSVGRGYGTDGKFYMDTYFGANSYFRFKKGDNSDYGPGTSDQPINVGSGSGQGNYNTNAWKYTGNAGIIRVCLDQTDGDNKDHYPYVWLERPKIVIKNATSWGTQIEMTDNQDGTYSVDYTYKSGGTNVGPKDAPAGPMKYFTDANSTINGSPSDGNKCKYVYNSNGYQPSNGSDQQERYRGSLTITRYVKVSFYDGSTKIDDVETLYNTNITTLAAPTKTGYDFVKWNTKADGTGTDVSPNVAYGAIKSDMNLYAKWTPHNYTITYSPAKDAENKHFTYTTAPDNADYNTTVTMTFTPATNYVIAGVKAYKTGTPATTVTVTETSTNNYKFTQPAYDVTVEVSVSLSQVNVTYGVNGSGQIIGKIGGVSIGASPTQVDGGSTVIFTATPSTGYHVVAWYTNSDCTAGEHDEGATSYTINNIDADANVYVKFAPNTYSVKFNGNGSTSGSMTDQAFTYDAAQNLTVNAFKRTGYTFQGWAETTSGTVKYQDKESVSNLTTTNGGTVTLYAIWEQKMYNDIAVASNNTDMGTVNQSSVSFGYTTPSASITATPKAGYYFTGWTLPTNATYASGSQTSTTITVKASGDDAVTDGITANFAERWVLRGSETATGNPESGMPGWSTTDAIFTFAADATTGTKTVTLLPNREYKFMVYDRKADKQRGYTSPNQTLGANTLSGTMNGEYHLLMNTAGYGIYTFTVQENDTREYPKIYITNPASYQITMAPKTYSDGNVSGNTGGTLTAKTTENGQDFEVSNDKYVRDGGSVTFTATPNTGYLFEGFYSNEDCAEEHLLQAASVGLTYTTTITTATTVYAKFSEILKEVTVIQGDGSQSTVKVGVASHPEITATAVSGKKFTGWSTNHVTVANANSKTTTITGYSDGYNAYSVTATWGAKDVIYVDVSKATSWSPSKMYVYFYKGAYPNFDDSGTGSQWQGNWGPTCMMFKGIPMTKIEGTTIWKAEYDKEDNEYFAYSSEPIKFVSFIDQEENEENRFYSCSLVYTEYDPSCCMNMFVLTDNTSYLKNTNACYYNQSNKGFWKSYNAPSSGLSVNLYDGGDFKGSTALDYDEGDGWYSGSVHMKVTSGLGSYNYYFIIGSCDGNNWSSKGWVINQGTSATEGTVYPFYKSTDVYGQKVTINATTTGSYKFFVKHNNNNELSLKVEYPVYTNDYRVVSVIGGEVHDNGYLYKSSTTEDEMASFYVVNDAVVKLQKCTAITGTTVTWSDVDGQSFTITGLSKPSVYNFKITHNGDNATLSQVGEYTGNFYIRTDVAAGGWNNYKENANNVMAKGAIFGYNNTYDYAYTNWAGANTSVRYTVANDYSKCISDTLLGDDVIGNDKDKLGSAGANIRFMWNSKNNQLKRDYIGGSNDDEEFLLIHGSDNAAATNKTKSKLYETADAASPIDNAKFHDDGNWIYSKEFYVEPGAYIALTAHFNNKTQFFHGAGNAENGEVTEYEQFVGGEGTTRLKMKVIYNFKTNELVAGYIPDDSPITTTIDLNSDLLWIRTQQGDATPINFSNTDAQIENIHKIYGVLEFCKDSMTNLLDNQKQRIPLTNTSYNRINYWISFPFDVRVSDIFGVDGYGEKWVIQYYNGELRAEIGWFQEKSTFWEWLDLDDIMYAGKGYTLNIDPEYFDEPSDDIWKDVESKVAFYFPSAANYNVNVIKQQEVTTKIPDHEYYRSVKFANDPSKDHKITDSYWNIIGTPAFQPTTISTASGVQGPKAIYVWKQGDGNGGNGYNIQETMIGFTFKPMRSYIVQYGGNVTWNSVSSIVKANQAPYAYADQKNYMVDLEFYFGEQRDHTYINLSDNATKEFKLNEDVMKMTNSGAPNIYSYAEGYDVAYNEVPMANQTINLGVIARKNGSYTFAMPKDFSGKAVLVDLESGEATDLNLSNYTVELNKGTYNNRFQLLLEVEAQSPTNIQNANGGLWSEDGKTQKLLINDNIYLINGGRVYNATGVQLR